MDAKDEVSFFQAVKARLVKFNSTGTGGIDCRRINQDEMRNIKQALFTDNSSRNARKTTTA